MINSRLLIIVSCRVMVLVSLLATVSCSVLPETTPVQLLDPQVAAPAVTRQSVAWTMNVTRPQSDSARDSNRVMVRTREGQLQIHPSARWVAASPDMLRTLLVRYLRDAGVLQQTATAAAGLDRTLALDLRQFELVEDNNQLEARISFEARLYDNRSAKLLARQVFARQQPVSGMQPASLVSGFETVLQQIIPATSDWLLSYDAQVQPSGSK